MANYTDNNIIFNNVKLQENGLAFGAGPICINGAQGVDSELGGVINAIDIDWNGAQVAGKTLNTTGEVLSN